jgi:hypothetical protein
MTMTPTPCIATNLDALQMRDLRTRLDAIWSRMDDPAMTVTTGSMGGGFELRDRHGVIRVYAMRSELVLKSGSCGDLGPSALEMPLPVEFAGETPVDHVMSKAGFPAVRAHLDHWKAAVEAEHASIVDGLRIGSSGFARMLRMVSSLIRSENPGLPARAKISFRCPTLYETAPTMFGEGPPAALGTKQSGTTIRPVINAALTERILALHPGLTIESNGGRDYRMRRLEEMTAVLPPVPAMEALRYAGDLGIDPTKRIVLKAGMDLG